MLLLPSSRVAFALNFGVSVALVSQRTNSTDKDDLSLKTSTIQYEASQESGMESLYVITPVLLILFMTIVSLSAFSFVIRKNKVIAQYKERRKQEALGNHYGTCKVNQRRDLEEDSELMNTNGAIPSYAVNIMSNGDLNPYVIHPVM